MKITIPLYLALSLRTAQQADAFTAHASARWTLQVSSTSASTSTSTSTTTTSLMAEDGPNNQTGKRSKIREFAKLVLKTNPVAPKAIASIITDATASALEEVSRVGKIRQSIDYSSILEKEAAMESETARALDTIALAKTTAADAFALAESAIGETEAALKKSKLALAQCRMDVAKAIAIAEKSARQANISSQKATVLAANAAITASGSSSKKAKIVAEGTSSASASVIEDVKDITANVVVEVEVEETTESLDIASLTYEDVDYHLSEMSPPFIGEDQCLVPGEAVVRVEKAMDNSRRIFAGIDIMASVDDVWKVSSSG